MGTRGVVRVLFMAASLAGPIGADTITEKDKAIPDAKAERGLEVPLAPPAGFGDSLPDIGGELWTNAGLRIPEWDRPQATAESAELWFQGDPAWPVLELGWVRTIPAREPLAESPGSGSFAKMLLVFCVAAGVLAYAGFRRARRWGSQDIAKYLERAGAPWGRREDLFLEKLVLELRVLRATTLSTELAMEGRFDDLDRVERPLRRMRARFRSVRREYSRVAERIGPVSDSVRHECAQAIRRSGLIQAPTLSKQEVESMRRLAADVERRKAELQESS